MNIMNPTTQKKFLQSCDVIDHQQPDVLQKAQQLAAGKQDTLAIIKACFEFVRDQIKHSADYQLNPITITASQVLKHGTGFCYAKSHLLAALLRANGIACGLCYQRLTITDDSPPFCLHGLNAVYLPKIGWYRIDARGNKAGVDAQFCPPQEKLAFNLVMPGEADLRQVWHEPMPEVIAALKANHSYEQLLENLPDVELI